MKPTDILRQSWHGNTVQSWSVAVGVALGIVVILLFARYLATSRWDKVARRTRSDLDDFAVDLIRRTRYFFVLFLGIWIGAQFLRLHAVEDRRLGQAAVIVFLLQSAIWGNALVGFWVRRFTAHRSSPEDIGGVTTVIATGYLARLIIWTLILLVGLENLGVNITALVAGLGITGIAVALAVQNVLGDLLAALSIVLDRPFVIGDAISVEGVDGTVERIGIKTTRVRSLSGEQVVLSNAELLKGRIRNFRRMDERRVMFLVGITYDTPPEKVARIPAMIREIVESQQTVRFDRAHFARFKDSALEFETVYYVTSPDYGRFMDIQQAVNLGLLRQFADEGIDFAFPTRMIIHATRGEGVVPAAPGIGG
jgi:small-conductance mechanosensitive channel